MFYTRAEEQLHKTGGTKMSKKIDPEELMNVAKAVEVTRYIIQEVMEDFFSYLNPDNKEDHRQSQP